MTGPPNWVLVAKAEDVVGTWWTIQGMYGACNLTGVVLTSTFAGESGATWVEDPTSGTNSVYRIVIRVDGDFRGDTVVTIDHDEIADELETNDQLVLWGF